MIGDLFDSPWKVLIVAVVLIVLFGSKKLPDAARSLGRSMRILKKEVSDLHHDESGTEPQATPRTTAGPSTQLTVAPVPAGASSEPQPTQQSG
jgi:sec-independent protein translocase protein TatA